MKRARDIMTRDVITVRPETTIEELAKLLTEKKISGAPVVDEEGNLRGIVTENDLIRKNKRLHIPTVLRLFDAFIMLGTGQMKEEMRKITATTVGEICTKEVISIREDTTIEDIATIMSEKNVHLLPVVEDQKVVGIVGKADIVRAMTR